VRSALACVVLLTARVAAAQSPGPAASFLPRADFFLQWSAIAASDPRFSWQGKVAFDADLVDFGAGRLAFAADYEAMLGGERRPYDLNQSTYRFEMAATRRVRSTEVAGIISHVSRHLVDRENPPSISWNAAGARVRQRVTVNGGATLIDGRIEITRAMQQAYVDYAWTSDARVSVRHALRPDRRVELLADVSGGVIGVHRALYGRPRICGGRIEGGVRVNGAAAALEIFAGYERRMDAFPTDRFRVRMWTVGFRLVN
jgi:hypothetical protein